MSVITADFYNSAESVVTYAATSVEMLLLVRLAWLGLVREFPIFWSFLAFDVIRTLALLGFDYHSASYEMMWVTSAPVWIVMLACVAVELMRGVAKPIPGEPISRRAAIFGFLAGVTITVVASMVLHPREIVRSAALLNYMAERCITSGCILATLAQALILTVGGSPLIGNYRRHRLVMLAFMTAIVVGSATATSNYGHLAQIVGLLRDTTLLVCYCAWIPAFERAWSHLHFPTRSYQQDMSEDTMAEIFAYNALAAKHPREAARALNTVKALS